MEREPNSCARGSRRRGAPVGAPKARIALRLREDLKQLIEAAAELSGQTVSGFVAATAVEGAKSLLESAHRIRLGKADAKVFLAAIERPVKRSDALGLLLRAVQARRRPDSPTR